MSYKLKALKSIDTHFEGNTIIIKDNIYETDGFYKSFNGGEAVKIMCDDGYMRHLGSDMFIRIDVLRDEKLNELLNDTVNDTVNDTRKLHLETKKLKALGI